MKQAKLKKKKTRCNCLGEIKGLLHYFFFFFFFLIFERGHWASNPKREKEKCFSLCPLSSLHSERCLCIRLSAYFVSAGLSATTHGCFAFWKSMASISSNLLGKEMRKEEREVAWSERTQVVTCDMNWCFLQGTVRGQNIGAELNQGKRNVNSDGESWGKWSVAWLWKINDSWAW